MIKKCFFILYFLSFCITPILKAQQYGLFNTKTLFDGFENPAQKTFVLDSSRKYASNFLLPYFGINAANKGNPDFIRKMINERKYNTSTLPLRAGNINTASQNTNIYLFTFKIFQSYKHQKELGFSWQLRSDAQVDYSNETLVILDSYKRFDTNPYDDLFNTDGYGQSYHQFSISYRENYNKKLAFGAKISLLNGITYNKLKITGSYLHIDTANDLIDVKLKGSYKASFLKTDELSGNTLIPTFKNPGLSLSFGTTYTSKKGVFIMANLKDLGAIKWSKASYVKTFNTQTQIGNLSQKSANQVKNEVTDIAADKADNESFYTLTNARADFLISKTFGFYTPSFIVFKNLFYKGGDVALVNRFRYSGFTASAIPTYDLNGLFLMGVQGMYQTPNFEVFIGSDDLFKTVSQVNGVINEDATIGSGYNSASFYMGIGIKFGNTVEHPQNSSTMPGVGEEQPGFFKRIFGIFSKK